MFEAIALQQCVREPVLFRTATCGQCLAHGWSCYELVMSHMLLGTFYDATPFDLLLPEEKNLFDNAEGLMDKDINTMRALARILSLSGIGMTICGGSQPAAQGEHLISHFIEMMAPENTDKSFHGEQIAVTTLVMARLQDRLLKSTPPQLSATKITKNDVYQIMGSDLGPASWNEFSQKCMCLNTIGRRNKRPQIKKC